MQRVIIFSDVNFMRMKIYLPGVNLRRYDFIFHHSSMIILSNIKQTLCLFSSVFIIQ